MRKIFFGGLIVTALQLITASSTASAGDVIPDLSLISRERPRLLLRPHPTALAISLDQLRNGPKGEDYEELLQQLKGEDNAAANALIWLLTGDVSAADLAIARMAEYEQPERYNTFHIHSRLTEFGLAYDWLYGYSGFSEEIRREIRRRVMPTAWRGYRNSNDHMFHNYVWMSAGASAIWALATAGEDAESDRLFKSLAERFNSGLFPAMRYLEGLPSEPLGYWFYYDFHPCMLTLLATQSAFEKDIVGMIAREQEDWVGRHFMTIVQGILPDLRFIPWGDLQSGSNGGVTIRAAGMIDAMTWCLNSPEGAWLGQWLAEKRGPERFHGWTAVFFMIYSRSLQVEPEEPALSYLSGNYQAGHFVARSGWDENATIVAFRNSDHYGDHNHHDQGSFIVYRNGLLAVDPPVYEKVRGPQEPTAVHNTLLLGGEGQRDCRGQNFLTVEIFEENRTGGPMLETGDILFSAEKGDWAAVAGQFAQAYEAGLVDSCVRQLLFLRPGTILVVDHLRAPPGNSLPSVEWLLQVPNKPEITTEGMWTSNGRSRLRLEPDTPESKVVSPVVRSTQVRSYTISLGYNLPDSGEASREELLLVHRLEVGPEAEPEAHTTAMDSRRGPDYYDIVINERAFRFNLKSPYAIQSIAGWD